MNNISSMNNMEIVENINAMLQELKDRYITIKDDNDMCWYLDKILFKGSIDEIIFTCETNQ